MWTEDKKWIVVGLSLSFSDQNWKLIDSMTCINWFENWIEYRMKKIENFLNLTSGFRGGKSLPIGSITIRPNSIGIKPRPM